MLAGKPYCSECERLQNENSLLRQQIALLNGSDSLLVSNRWQTLLIVGWLLLTILPIMAALMTSSVTSELLEYVGLGIGIGGSWSQCSILFLVLVLLNVRISQKLLIFVLAVVAFFTCWVSTKDMQALPYMYALIAPVVSAIIAIPAIVCRIVYRWQIAHVSSRQQGKPASIATYLLLTLAVASLISAISWLPNETRVELVNARFFVTFGGPIISSMMLTIAIVCYFLSHRPMYRTRGMYTLLICELLCVSLCLCAMVCVAKLQSPTQILLYGLFGATFAIVFSLWFAVAMLWLRLLGFRLMQDTEVKQAQPF